MHIIRYFVKPLIWCMAIFPIIWIIFALFSKSLGANPIEYINRFLGETALNFLFFTLFITPLRIFTGWKPIIQVRRLMGLFAFFYATLHFCFYIGIEQFFDWNLIWEDLLKRKYILFGFLAFLILIPLAITSQKRVRNTMKMSIWKILHKGIFVSAFAAILHFFMMQKGFQIEPFYYLGMLVFLSLIRIAKYSRNKP